MVVRLILPALCANQMAAAQTRKCSAVCARRVAGGRAATRRRRRTDSCRRRRQTTAQLPSARPPIPTDQSGGEVVAKGLHQQLVDEDDEHGGAHVARPGPDVRQHLGAGRLHLGDGGGARPHGSAPNAPGCARLSAAGAPAAPVTRLLAGLTVAGRRRGRCERGPQNQTCAAREGAGGRARPRADCCGLAGNGASVPARRGRPPGRRRAAAWGRRSGRGSRARQRDRSVAFAGAGRRGAAC